MKIATFNVNSISVRLPVVTQWTRDHAPDILMLQELKTLTPPVSELEALGYHVFFHGQKTYNGVMTLVKKNIVIPDAFNRHPRAGGDLDQDKDSRFAADAMDPVCATPLRGGPRDDKVCLLPGDDQARYLEVQVGNVRVVNIYAPNGNPISSVTPAEAGVPMSRDPGLRRDDKFAYKLAWLDALCDRVDAWRAAGDDVILAGDFNIIPTDLDAARPGDWAADALARPESRARYRRMIWAGMVDSLRALHPADPLYTFWDYQAGAWPRNNGIRIDHILLTPRLADKLVAAGVDKAPRGGEKPSDHTPVWVEINI